MKASVVLFAALLLGVGYPLSKIFFDQGLDILPFCLCYVAARLIVQMPAVVPKIWSRKWNLNFSQLKWLLGFGMVGGLLRICEMIGIAQGISVSVVTFLVFSHPIWLAVIGRFVYREKYTASALTRIALAVGGIGLLTGLSRAELGATWILLAAPLLAGFLVAMWIVLSQKIQNKGVPLVAVSFFYDLFSFTLLISATLVLPSREGAWSFLSTWASNPIHILEMVAFGGLVGVLPNYCFYWGGRGLPAFVPAALLLFQPVFAAIVSHFLWGEKLSDHFLVGASFILIANLPEAIYARIWGSLHRSAVQKPRALILHVIEGRKVLPSRPSRAVNKEYIHL